MGYNGKIAKTRKVPVLITQYLIFRGAPEEARGVFYERVGEEQPTMGQAPTDGHFMLQEQAPAHGSAGK